MLSAFDFAILSQMQVMSKKLETQSGIMMNAWSHYTQITSRVLACVFGSIALLGIPTYFLDQFFGTWPIITGVALIFSIPLSQFMVVKSMQSFIKTHPQD